MKSSRIQEGSSLQLPAFLNMESHPEPAREFIRLPVMSDDGLRDLRLTDRDLSKHVLTLGGIGCGKTNLIDLMTGQIVTHMTPDDVMVIFDTKGDFLRKFAAPGDIVFGNLTQLPNGVEHAKWNLYREVLIDEDQVQQNLMEVCRSLFLERSRHTTNPFFPNAAWDILYGYMMANLRSGPHSQLNNASILHFFQSLDIDALKALFQNQDDLKSCLYYIEGKNQQTQGVVSEVVQLVREIFVGSFAQAGNTSVRQLVREKNKRKIFIEYDLGLGNILTPIYSLLIDMVIKEALCRDARQGNVFVVIDEFSLLPNLQHIGDGVNFGRELGIKFIVGLQNVEQIYASYGEYEAGSILSGFNTRFFFKVNDSSSRRYVQELLGHNCTVRSYAASDRSKGTVDQISQEFVLEDWVYDQLPVGAAVFYQNGKPAQILGLPEYQGLDKPPRNMFALRRSAPEPVYNPKFKRLT